MSKFNCDDCVCEEANGFKSSETMNCSYCKAWAEKTISYNEEERTEWILKSEDVNSGLVESKLFK